MANSIGSGFHVTVFALGSTPLKESLKWDGGGGKTLKENGVSLPRT